MKLKKKKSKMATENTCATSLFDENEVFLSNENENNNENNKEKLPLALFQDIEIELREMLFFRKWR